MHDRVIQNSQSRCLLQSLYVFGEERLKTVSSDGILAN